MAEIRLRSDYQYDFFGGDNLPSLYIFSVVAVLILGIAGVNYINLATARSTRRATEVGVRKVLGADRHQLTRQFLSESVLTAAVALVVALVLASLVMPAFNTLAGKSFSAEDVVAPSVLAWFIPVTILVGFIAGVYPALVLTRFRPARVLKRTPYGSSGSATLRRALVVFQFAATFALLIGTGTVYRQLHYFERMDLGFRRDHLVFAQMPVPPSPERMGVLKSRMEAHPNVLGTAASSAIPVGPAARHDTQPGGRPPGERWLMAFYGVDADFIETMGFEIVAGRAFSAESGADTLTEYILNEAAVARLGWQDDPVGRDFTWINPNAGLEPGRVVGVVRDFTYEGFREPIEPAFFVVAPGWTNTVAIRISPRHQAETLAHLQNVWEGVVPEYPFEHLFLDEGWSQLVSSERRFGQVFAAFALLTLFVACLGLFGLTAYAAEQRRKEITVRKVMGATSAQIVLLLTRDVLLLVGSAFALAAPLAFWIMSRWLDEFEYQVEIGAGVILSAAAVGMVVALATVAWQAVRAATADPARSLRYE